MRWEFHDRSTSGGSWRLGETYGYTGDTFFTSIDSERTGALPGIDDWVYNSAGGTSIPDDTKITAIELNTPFAGVTTFHVNRAFVGDVDPGVLIGKSIKEIMRITPDRQLLVRKFIADDPDSAAEFGKVVVGVTPTEDNHLATKEYVDDAVAGSGSGITRSIVVTSGNATAGSTSLTDYVYIISGAHTITLPTCVGNTNRYTLKNAHSANVSLAFTSSQTADGGGITLAPGESVDLISNNTEWKII